MEAGLQPYGLPLAEVVPLLAGLLSVPLPAERYAPLTLTPQQQKQQTLDALVAWMVAEAERQPVLVAWEDLHWADPTTLEILGLVVEQAPTVPMLHVLTYRPEFSPPWPQRSHMTPLVLNRLERPQVEALITQRAGGKTLPAEVVQHIVAKTDGVPLYVEELTKMLLASPLLREEGTSMCSPGRCARWRFRTPCRMRSWPGWISSIRPKRWRSSGRCWGGSFPMSCSRPLPRRTRTPYRRGWRSWWGPNSSTNGGGRRGPGISLSTP